MGAKELFQAGKLNEAVVALGAEVRDNPTDVRRRTFLFELLCFQGEFDRAEKHLHVLAGSNPEAQMGAVLYFSALHAERVRHDLFAKKEFPLESAHGHPGGGTIDGRAFENLEDSDPRVGPRLELFAAGAYLWIPFEHIEAIEIQQPRRLRDLLWVPALVRTGPSFRGTELGEVLLPVLAPFSYKHSDDNVRLGRATEWVEQDGMQVPVGQRMFSVDEDDIPVLDIRKIDFAALAEAEDEAQATSPSGT